MRKIIAITQLTLDGVMQAPGGPQEDPRGGFKHGGWRGARSCADKESRRPSPAYFSPKMIRAFS